MGHRDKGHQCQWEAWVSSAHSAPAGQPIGQADCLPMIHERHKRGGLKGGPGAGLALSTCPVNRLTTFTYFTSFPRHLVASIAPSPSCLCGLLLDSRGILGGRGWAVENAAARVCRNRGQSDHERASQGPRLLHPTLRTPGGLKWSLTGCPVDHDTGECLASRRFVQEESFSTRRAGRRSCTSHEGANLS